MPLEGEPSLAWSLVETTLALVGVCLLAVVALRWASVRGLGRPRGRWLEVVDRVPLDARRSVVAVRVAGRLFLLGLGEGAAPSLLAELDGASLPDATAVPTRASTPEIAKDFGSGSDDRRRTDGGERRAVDTPTGNIDPGI